MYVYKLTKEYTFLVVHQTCPIHRKTHDVMNWQQQRPQQESDGNNATQDYIGLISYDLITFKVKMKT